MSLDSNMILLKKKKTIHGRLIRNRIIESSLHVVLRVWKNDTGRRPVAVLRKLRRGSRHESRKKIVGVAI